MTKRLVVLGALSEIAEQTCRLAAAGGASLMLVGRDRQRLEALAADLEIRGASAVHVEAVDLVEGDPEILLSRWSALMGGIDQVLLAYGQLGDQAVLAHDLAATCRLIDTNFGSAAAWCLAAADRFEQAGTGTLVVIGSVAGDRGRQSNYIYGATKAGLAVLVEGIAHRLASAGARAVLVKPGLVATAMTAHMPQGGPLWSRPEIVAKTIYVALNGSGAPVVYAPGFWRPVMAIIRNVPYRIFHKTKL